MSEVCLFGLNSGSIGKIISVFKSHPSVTKVLIYGSRAKGNHKPTSDIDLTLVGDRLDIQELLKIENELDDLLLPQKIDLSLFQQIENADLIDHIERVGQVLYRAEAKIGWRAVIIFGMAQLVPFQLFIFALTDIVPKARPAVWVQPMSLAGSLLVWFATLVWGYRNRRSFNRKQRIVIVAAVLILPLNALLLAAKLLD